MLCVWDGIGELGNTGGFSELTYISIRYLWSRNKRQKNPKIKKSIFLSVCISIRTVYAVHYSCYQQ
jgi:hypothetical protein